ncbi:MAG TPA: hypothetical protein DIW17_07500 [Clostridiales bacterium]|nr:hypothetical protein [Clostridiales bacterium]
MSENRNLDDFLDSLDSNHRDGNESDFGDKNMDDIMKQKILKKTYGRLRKKRRVFYGIVAGLVLVLLSSFIPNTPTYALRQAILSYIPGIGVVQGTDDTGTITGILAEPVKVSDGDEFIEIRSAYEIGKVLNIYGVTNVGLANVDIPKGANKKEVLEFYSGETARGFNIVHNGESLAAGNQIAYGGSFIDGVYSIEASFYLSKSIGESDFQIEIEGFAKPVILALSPVISGTIPEEVGNAATIDNITAFSYVTRKKDIVEVLVSFVGSNEYKNLRTYLFEHEKEIFDEGVHLIDQDGVVYEPDDDLTKEHHTGINTYYFHVPEDKEGLKLVIPQVLYDMEYKEADIKITMPKKDKDTVINRHIDMGSHTITLNRASIVQAGDAVLHDDFKFSDNLMIEASAEIQEGTGKSVIRMFPDILSGNLMNKHDWISHRMSRGSYAPQWDPIEQKGQSFTVFDDMEKTRKIIINFKVEFSMTGPWEIDLK